MFNKQYPFYSLLKAKQPLINYGRFVVCRDTGANLRAAYSDDGITWTTATTPNSGTYYCIDFSPELKLYVATAVDAATNNIMTSPNGITWTLRSKPNNDILTTVRWCKEFGLFLIHGVAYIFSSPDGINWSVAWTRTDSTYQTTCLKAGYKPGLWCSAESKSSGSGLIYIISTTDGINFSRTSTGYTGVVGSFRSIVYNADLDVWGAVSQAVNNIYFRATNPLSTWSSISRTSAAPQGHVYAKNLFVIPNPGTRTDAFYYSTSALVNTFTASVLPSATYDNRDVCYSTELDLFVASSRNANLVATSKNGITWTTRTSASNQQMICFGPGVK